ncbi:GntR family transcriptional regulator [Nocardiopsis dassonvillei]|uniref:GntR family transcriptional regulator n=1 Tax=Nocardiopsis dassonvillei TaxID=2014 RepID=UPI003F55C8D6
MTAAKPTPGAAPAFRGYSRGLSAQVYDWLYEAIVSVRLEPARRLSENELAAELGVSRTPVRDALYRLAEEGLVDVFPQRGTFVARIDRQGVADAQFVREALERAAFREAVGGSGPRDLEAMRENLRSQERARDRGDIEGFFDLDQRFHQLFFDAAGHPGAGRVARRARPQMDRVRRLALPDTTGFDTLLEEHRALVEAVAEGDAEGGDAVLTGHLRLVLEAVDRVAASHPGYFA